MNEAKRIRLEKIKRWVPEPDEGKVQEALDWFTVRLFWIGIIAWAASAL